MSKFQYGKSAQISCPRCLGEASVVPVVHSLLIKESPGFSVLVAVSPKGTSGTALPAKGLFRKIMLNITYICLHCQNYCYIYPSYICTMLALCCLWTETLAETVLDFKSSTLQGVIQG